MNPAKAAFAVCLALFFGASVAGIQVWGQEEKTAKLDYSAGCTSSGCHENYTKRKLVHDPVASGDCDSCHEAIEGEEHRFSLIAEGADLCFECHDDYAEDLKFLHGPVAAGACTACHDNHASDHSALLLSEIATQCLTCHTVLKERMDGSTYKHDPAIEDCIDCHDVHGAGNKMLLVMDMPGLCFDCHDEIQDLLNEATVSHDAMTKGGTCSDCHDPHAANFEHILSKEPLELCMSCHNEALGSGSDMIDGLGTLLNENPNHHGPIREKNCTACHTGVHGGEKFRLLAAEYPPEFYAPYNEERYAFCFLCHEPDLVREEKTDKLTHFRNGDQNLHFLHVNREKGRTCRACHETHASKNPMHLTESVPFGESGWKIPIKFNKSENGGSCLTGCHKEYTYDRLSAVVNIPR